MRYRAYSIFDKKAEAFMPPFFFTADGQATRAFSDMANDKSHMVGRHPEDFELYVCAGFDDGTGVFDGVAVVKLVSATSVLKEK